MNDQNYTRSAGNVHPQIEDFESTALQCGVDPVDLSPAPASKLIPDKTRQTPTNRDMGPRFIVPQG